MSRHFGRVCQNGYVVTDIEAPMRHWTEVVGVDPFVYVERVPFGEFRDRGEESGATNSHARWARMSGGFSTRVFQTIARA